MKERRSFLGRYELFVAAGTLAAHATNLDTGFRQKETKFFTELFSNWMDATLDSSVLELQNTQVKRYLESLVEDGYGRVKSGIRPPTYQLTRGGVIELLERLRYTEYWPHPGHFFFVYFFFRSYGPLIIGLLEEGKRPFPPAFRSEIERLIDSEDLRKEQIARTKYKVRELTARVDSAPLSSTLAREALRENRLPAEVFSLLEEHYPYQLNNQRPLSSLLGVLSQEQALWEVQEGTIFRSQFMWKPLLRLTENYLKVLEKLPAYTTEE